MPNVAPGGTLDRHLPDISGGGHYQPGGWRFNAVAVDIRPGSRPGRLIGSEVLEGIPVSRHQALDRPGQSLVARAWSQDQIVEAIELTGHRFCLGVQRHPEQMPGEKALFSGFIEAASGKMLSRLVPRQPLLPESFLPGPTPANWRFPPFSTGARPAADPGPAPGSGRKVPVRRS